MTKTCLEFYKRGGKSPIATVDGAARINPPPTIRYCVIVVPSDNTGTPLA